MMRFTGMRPPLDESRRTARNRVMGCTAQVWLDAWFDEAGGLRFAAASDSEITRGLCGCLVWVLDGASPDEVLALTTEDLAPLSGAIGLHGGVSKSRANTWYNVLLNMHKRTNALLADRQGKLLGDPFPPMLVSSDGIVAKGGYAEVQVHMLKEKKIGIVAHLYMDPEVRGVLNVAQK